MAYSVGATSSGSQIKLFPAMCLTDEASGLLIFLTAAFLSAVRLHLTLHCTRRRTRSAPVLAVATPSSFLISAALASAETCESCTSTQSFYYFPDVDGKSRGAAFLLSAWICVSSVRPQATSRIVRLGCLRRFFSRDTFLQGRLSNKETGAALTI